MHLVSRALVWVRVVFFGPPPESDRAPREPETATVDALGPRATTPGRTVTHPSPEMWAAFLASARRRRARCAWPAADLPAVSSDDIASTLVGAYVLAPEVRQQRRQARRFAEVGW